MKPTPLLMLFLGLAGLFPASVPAVEETPAAAPATVADALLQKWSRPDYPADWKREKKTGWARVELVVDPQGQVSQAQAVACSDARLGAPAVACVRQWIFAPAEENGVKVASALAVRLIFDPQAAADTRPCNDVPRPLDTTPPEITFAPDPLYPAELEHRRLNGGLLVHYTITPEGTATNVEVLTSTDVAFIPPTLAALTRWRFKPAQQGPLPVSGSMKSVIAVSAIGSERRSDILAANGISASGGAPLETLPGCPEPVVAWAPVYAREWALAGEAGVAVLEFTVDETGLPQDFASISATQPALAEALQAALETWQFKAAVCDGETKPVRLRITHAFGPAAEGSAEARLVAALKTPGAISSAKGLDQKLTPRWRCQPVYPSALTGEKPSGTADVEVVIDREGRVRLPRLVQASHPAFGWAAATAVQQWLFSPPTRAGQPVDVRIRIPFSFTPPAR